MKTIILLFSGLFDRPEPLNSTNTPLSRADTPVLRQLARRSRTGFVQTVPTHFTPVADAGALSMLGITPIQGENHRAGYELTGSGLTMKKDDTVLFCRLVSLSEEEDFEQRTMLSAAPALSAEQKKQLWDDLRQSLKSRLFELRTAPSGKTFLLWHKGEPSPGHFSPPEAALGRPIAETLPTGDFTPPLVRFMKECAACLQAHPLCREAKTAGKPAPNGVWLWGACAKPPAGSFAERFSVKAAAVSTNDYFSGIARTEGLHVQRAESSLEPEALSARAAQTIRLLTSYNCVYVYHDALARCRSFSEKVTAIETVDRHFLAPLMSAAEAKQEPFCLLLAADHVVPAALGFPTLEAVPYLLFQSDSPLENPLPFTETLPVHSFLPSPKDLLAFLKP